MTPNIAVIPGEDAAPEAMDAALRVLDALDVAADLSFPVVGLEAERKFGSPFPDEARQLIDDADTTLFGATSGPSGIALFYLRVGKETYANIRPAQWMPGARSPLSDPASVDFVIVRENLEGLYCGLEGPLADLEPLGLRHPLGHALHDQEGRFTVKVVTDAATRRIAKFAAGMSAERAEARQGARITVGAKNNVLAADARFVDVALEVLEDQNVEVEVNHIDNLARRMVAEPGELDVVLVPNLYGDILSDLAAGLIGGLGLMPSGCYGDDYAYFEPPHGTAPDLVGLDAINPTAQMLTVAMMLDYLSYSAEANRVRRAISAVYADGSALTRDQGGNASTAAFTDAAIESLSAWDR